MPLNREPRRVLVRRNQSVLELSTVDAVNANDVRGLNVRNIQDNFVYVVLLQKYDKREF